MRISKFLATTLTIGGLAGGGLSFAAEKNSIIQQYKSEVSYRASTVEARGVGSWLQLHATDHADVITRSRGDEIVRVTYATTSQSLRPMTDPGPPVPLPASGNSGDVITVEHTSGGWQRSWTFIWRSSSSGGGWFQTRYEEVYVNTVPR